MLNQYSCKASHSERQKFIKGRPKFRVNQKMHSFEKGTMNNVLNCNRFLLNVDYIDQLTEIILVSLVLAFQLMQNRKKQIIQITNNYQPKQHTRTRQMEENNDIVEQLSVDLNLEEMIILTQCLLNDMIAQEGFDGSSIFNSNSKPPIRLDAFLRRIHKYTRFSPQCLILAIIYIDRYNMAKEEFSLNWLNVHKILLTALLIAVKFHDDLYYDNKAFELAGGVNTAQLMKFELQIFSMLDFNTFVGFQEYEALLKKLYDVYAD